MSWVGNKGDLAGNGKLGVVGMALVCYVVVLDPGLHVYTYVHLKKGRRVDSEA